MFFKKSLIAATLVGVLGSVTVPLVQAQAVQATGRAEVDLKKFKDQIAARAAVRKIAERDAIKSALKLKLNISATTPEAEAAIDDFVKNLADNLKSTFRTEGDVLTATSQLTVDSAELTDMARSLGLQDKNVMEASSILFIIDEYWGIATNLDPSKPMVSEVEVFQDKSSFSDTSAKASGSSYSDTSAKGSASASNASSLAASSKESSSLAASSKQSSSMAASDKTSIDASRSSSFQGRDSGALAASGSGGSLAAARDTQVSGAQRQSLSGSSSSSLAASSNSDNRLAASSSSDNRMAASSQSASASSFDKKNVKAQSSSSDVKNVQRQTDVTVVKTKTVFPEVNNAKPSDSQAALISQRLAQVTKQYGLEYTPERDLRETGKGRMLIVDIESQRRWDEYTAKAGKNPYNAKFVVFGTSVMNAEGRSASGQTLCSGMLKLESFSVDTGRGLVAGTLNKGAQGSSDQDCRSNLSTALATELAQTVGNAATRPLQLVATQGQSYTITLFSTTSISRRVGGPFEDALRAMANGNIREDKRTEAARVYTVSYKGGDFGRRIEKLLDELGEVMKAGEVASRGNRFVVCVEGKCPSEY